MIKRNGCIVSLGILWGLLFGWIIFTWALERWGGTICIAQSPHYISREEILLIGVDRYLATKRPRLERATYREYDIRYDWNAARKFVFSHEGCCYIKRVIAIKYPNTYWIAVFFPFDRAIIATKSKKESHDISFFIERDSGYFYKPCTMSSILNEHPI